MGDVRVTGLFVWKSVAMLGYPALESYLSIRDSCDENLICVDPTSDAETLKLVDALVDKFPDTRRVDFVWPAKTSDGSAIGIATNFAKAQARGTHVLNVQADEVYSPVLAEWCKTGMRDVLRSGLECIRFKILHTEWNAQRFQGGESWDGRKDTDEWRRGGLFNGQKGGAGYNVSVKLGKNCPAVKSAHDGWQWEGCDLWGHATISDEYPIVHLHDMMRDHYIALRKNAGYTLWDDVGGKYEFYKADADRVESTVDQWYNNPVWTQTVSPFDSLLPEVAKRLIGKTHYEVDYSLLSQY